MPSLSVTLCGILDFDDYVQFPGRLADDPDYKYSIS